MHALCGFRVKELFEGGVGGEQGMVFANFLVSGSFPNSLSELWSRADTVLIAPRLPFADHSIKLSAVTARISKREAALYVAGSVSFQNRFWSQKELRVFSEKGWPPFMPLTVN